MAQRFKVATYKLLEAVKAYFKELRGIYPYTGDTYYCPVCTSNLKYFKGISHDYLKKLEDHAFIFPFFLLETSGIANFACPHCGATDRDRLFAEYFNRRLAEYSGSNKLDMLDIAPQIGLKAFFKRQPKLNYRCADLYNPDVDDKVDISDMHLYKDSSFDIFLCSHVLEYVKEDRKAMSEFFRVLRPGGWGIAMVPIIRNLEQTYEDPTKTTVAEQWEHFMDDGHVRMYAKQDFVSKLESVGFKMKFLDASYFGMDTFLKDGIQERSVLYVVEKPLTK